MKPVSSVSWAPRQVGACPRTPRPGAEPGATPCPAGRAWEGVQRRLQLPPPRLSPGLYPLLKLLPPPPKPLPGTPPCVAPSSPPRRSELVLTRGPAVHTGSWLCGGASQRVARCPGAPQSLGGRNGDSRREAGSKDGRPPPPAEERGEGPTAPAQRGPRCPTRMTPLRPAVGKGPRPRTLLGRASVSSRRNCPELKERPRSPYRGRVWRMAPSPQGKLLVWQAGGASLRSRPWGLDQQPRGLAGVSAVGPAAPPRQLCPRTHTHVGATPG